MVEQGIIPANTGRICRMTRGRRITRDHPREYGENPAPAPGVGAGRWIIPANTGRIAHALNLEGKGGDHPREYGENAGFSAASNALGGSSPRIRGESILNQNVDDLPGIIPANTGRMSMRHPTTLSPTDHPREYGENRRSKSSSEPLMGSSPRIRGE